MARLTSIAVLVLIVAGGAAWWIFHARAPTAFAGGTRVELASYRAGNPSGVPAALANADPVKRGEYLARAGDCVACHTAPGGEPFAGGLAFKLPFGTLYTTNITPDRDTGIGAWSDEDFVKAMHEGVAPGGRFLYPAFPYTAYSLLTREDVLAIKTYLFSLKPVHAKPPENALWFPFNQRYLMFFWDRLFNRGEQFQPVAERPLEWNRGAYLVEALGHCGECHTERNLLFGLKSNRKFGGTEVRGWQAYNLSSDPHSGLGAWSDEELAAYLSTGHAPGHSSAAGPMAEALDNSLRFLAPEDVHAMVTYLRTLPPIRNASDSGIARTPPVALAGEGSDDPGLRMFEGACASCHRWDGSGAQSPYAALLGSHSVNDPAATNLLQAVLHGASVHGVYGEEVMPAFGASYSDRELAALANYVTGRFGSRASELTPADVARRRGED